MDTGPLFIPAIADTFRKQKKLADGAIAQLNFKELRTSLDPETNSVAIIMKHLAGSMTSRFTDFLTSDGEKPGRGRDNEFIDTFTSRAEIIDTWDRAWALVLDQVENLSEADLSRTVTIRTEPHTVPLALARALAHAGYHCGQIVQVARILVSRAGRPWNTLTIPRGGSDAFNRKMGHRA